jgi:hypothetical protein
VVTGEAAAEPAPPQQPEAWPPTPSAGPPSSRWSPSGQAEAQATVTPGADVGRSPGTLPSFAPGVPPPRFLNNLLSSWPPAPHPGHGHRQQQPEGSAPINCSTAPGFFRKGMPGLSAFYEASGRKSGSSRRGWFLSLATWLRSRFPLVMMRSSAGTAAIAGIGPQAVGAWSEARVQVMMALSHWLRALAARCPHAQNIEAAF